MPSRAARLVKELLEGNILVRMEASRSAVAVACSRNAVEAGTEQKRSYKLIHDDNCEWWMG